MATLEVNLRTGSDDLRKGSWANLLIKLAGQATPVMAEKFTGDTGLAGNSYTTRSVEIPNLTDPNQVEYLQIEHVSQEGSTETRDNWDLQEVRFIMRLGRFPVVIAENGFHRFSGSSATLTVYPPQA